MVLCLELAQLLIPHDQHLFQNVVTVFKSRLLDRHVFQLGRKLSQLLFTICQLGLQGRNTSEHQDHWKFIASVAVQRTSPWTMSNLYMAAAKQRCN